MLETSPFARRKSLINTWKPKPSQIYVEPDGKRFICHFDKIFDNPKLSGFNIFFINKGSYENQLDLITRYTNFFMNIYDTDNELALAYLKCQFILLEDKRYNADNMEAFISFIYEIMFTPSIVKKITKMVEDNYLDDIESDTSEKKKYMKNERKHLESLEFTNQHIKILLRISFGMKIMSPVLFHFLYINHIKIDKDSEIIYYFYDRLFEIFGYSNLYEYYDGDGKLNNKGIEPEVVENGVKEGWLTPVENGYETYYYKDDGSYYTLGKINMFNKLFVYVKAKVHESYSNNSLIFDQREIFGIDLYTVINLFTKKVLISENMVKYRFNENWDIKQKKYRENIIGFNKTIIKFQLTYFIKDQYQKNVTEVTNTRNSDGLSSVDKMAMNLTKIDEGKIIMAEVNLDMTIERLNRMIDVDISEEEIAYYRKHMNPHKLQIQLIYSYFAKYFGGYEDLNLAIRKDYIRLALKLKKKLLIDAGYDKSEYGKIHQTAIPYILTGNFEDEMSTRTIRNSKFLALINDSYLWQNLIDNKYRLLEEEKPGYILQLLSKFINTRFSYVVYEKPEMLGQDIQYSDVKIADELLFFLNSF